MTLDQAWLKARADDLAASMLFLTRLRFGGAAPISGATITQAAWAFPLIGVLVGLIGALVYALADLAGLPAWPAAALAVAATMAITGCLHEDGLADTIDGFGGGSTRERKLEIMRDSRIGVYGVAALTLSILLRVSAIASLGAPSRVALALIAAHGAARAVVPVFMVFVPPARSDGLSAGIGQPPRESAAAAAILGVLILGLCLGLSLGFAAVILLVIAAALLAWLTLTQIGGQTGDVLGAVEQASEIIVFLAALI
jgi:adenosylcobinamide-GDP ribazoletransferase